jgi:membrane protein required for colicin V production
VNLFDAVVYAAAILAIVMGFRAGLLRSLTTIIAYIIAAPIAVALTPRLIALAPGLTMTPEKTSLALCAVLLAVGALISALLRTAVSEVTGAQIGVADRLGGAVLGAVRTALLAVLMILIFDRIIPAGRDPPFLADSKLRPYLSAAGQRGLKALPPEVDAYIERLKRQSGI